MSNETKTGLAPLTPEQLNDPKVPTLLAPVGRIKGETALLAAQHAIKLAEIAAMPGATVAQRVQAYRAKEAVTALTSTGDAREAGRKAAATKAANKEAFAALMAKLA